jgi:hypothetical protein
MWLQGAGREDKMLFGSGGDIVFTSFSFKL